MTRKAKICQSIIIVACLYPIAVALRGYAMASFAHNPRVSASYLLSLAVNLMVIWKIITSPKSWSMGLGLFFAFGAVALPLSYHLLGRLLPGFHVNDPGVVLRIILSECRIGISAICCFILRRELAKEVPNEPSASAQDMPGS